VEYKHTPTGTNDGNPTLGSTRSRSSINGTQEGIMGVWSTTIFGDDTACDVRDAYRELVAHGLSGPEATDQLLPEWQETIDDEDDGPVFWLALAATQWACGRLEDRVKARAMKVLDDGSSLGRWSEGSDSRLLKQRQAALAKLRDQLQSPQPAVKRIRKRPATQCPWTVGEVLAYRLHSGKSVLLHVVGEFGQWPIFAILEWMGKGSPSEERIKELPLKTYHGTKTPYLVAVMRRNKKDLPVDRIVQLAIRRKPHQRRITGGYGALFWKDLDADLKSQFGLK
jgi:hypothetical protein